MASSGTVSLEVNFKFSPRRGREEAIMGGRAQIKSTAVIEAQELELKTIKVFVATPYAAKANSTQDPPSLFGSVIGAGSLMNSVTLKTLRGSVPNPVTGGTIHLGTVAAGTIQFGFIAIGG